MWCYLCDLRFAVLVELRLVADRRTDRQTDTDTGPWLVPRMHSIARQKNGGIDRDATYHVSSGEGALEKCVI